MSDLPSYPSEAAEREEQAPAPQAAREYASWGNRGGAYLIDSLLLVVPFVAILGVLFALDPDDGSGAWSLLLLAYAVTIVLPFVYFTVLHARDGQTVGKRATKIRVVDSEGSPLSSGHAFGRYAMTFVFGMFVVPLLVDYLWPLWDARNQTLHDKIIGSYVVRA